MNCNGDGIVKKLVNICMSNKKEFLSPVTRILGNLVTSTDEITDLVLANDGLKHICNLLNSDKAVIRKEAAWTISNIAAGTTEQVEMLFNLGVFVKISQLIREDTEEVKVECS